jgi:NADH-quinone oxidoreductase subunit M
MVLLGSFPVYRWMTIAACGGILLAAAYLLYMIQRVLLGAPNPKWSQLPDINAREIFTLVPLMVLILWVGVYPKIAIQYITPAIETLVRTLGGSPA